MSWVTKNLALDLLAITIHGLQKAFDRINDEPESTSPWDEGSAPAQVEEAPAPQAPEPQQPEPAAAPEPESAGPGHDELLAEAQTHLRTIALTPQGTEWITGELFPKYGVQTLTDVPTDQLPGLIAAAEQKAQQ